MAHSPIFYPLISAFVNVLPHQNFPTYSRSGYKKSKIRTCVHNYVVVTTYVRTYVIVICMLNKNTLGVKKCEANQKQH